MSTSVKYPSLSPSMCYRNLKGKVRGLRSAVISNHCLYRYLDQIRAWSSIDTTGSPDLLKALMLRLETQLWLTSKRNFPRLQSTLLGYSAPSSRPGLSLRVCRAACIRDICYLDPFKGTELVTGIQVWVVISLVTGLQTRLCKELNQAVCILQTQKLKGKPKHYSNSANNSHN